MTFEQRLERLEGIVAELQGDEIELARALALFEEGVQCLRFAHEELASAEATIERLVERADGSLEVVPESER